MIPFLTVRHAGGSYPVWLDRGLLDQTGRIVEPRGSVFIITSPTLRQRFGERVAASFEKTAAIIELEEGEANKTLATAESLLTRLLGEGAHRDAMVIAVGGGMIGDTAGFAASILLRGVDLVQVPTTLLAQVDSSIGGKVGVNHAKGKNLIGGFHQPRAVITDPDALDSLPQREFLSGLFEALKGGVVGDSALFERIETDPAALLQRDAKLVDEVVRRKISVKAKVVSDDEREGGLRRILNYGHTIGHAIETAASYEGITHGEAVGWGMIGANAVARRRGILREEEAGRIERTIRTLQSGGLPPLDRSQVLAAARHDKKNRRETRVMVLPRAIGECEIVEDVTEAELAFGIDAALADQ
jgi:3-dehydroquinate synthase